MEDDAATSLKVRRRGLQQRTVETQGKIIDAAAMEFALRGYEGASTRTIANNASVQHTLVTYHFKSKEGLWRATLDRLSREQKEAFEKRMEGLRGVDPSTALYLYLKDFIYFSAERPEYAWIMSHVAGQPSSQLDWLYEEHLRDGFGQTEALIVEAQKAGKFVDGNPRYMHYLLIGMVSRIFMLSAEVEMVLGLSPFEPEFVEYHASRCLGFFFKNMPEVEAGRALTFPKKKPVRRRKSAPPGITGTAATA